MDSSYVLVCFYLHLYTHVTIHLICNCRLMMKFIFQVEFPCHLHVLIGSLVLNNLVIHSHSSLTMDFAFAVVRHIGICTEHLLVTIMSLE